MDFNGPTRHMNPSAWPLYSDHAKIGTALRQGSGTAPGRAFAPAIRSQSSTMRPSLARCAKKLPASPAVRIPRDARAVMRRNAAP
jgi:hypothetical protein